jgi:tetratricopeptide (TPR) repeat protein
MIEGKHVPAGEYALFTIPDEKNWTVIFSKNIDSGTAEYKEEDDVVRFKVAARSLNTPVERLTMEIADMTDESARFILRWAATEVSFGMKVDTESKVMGQIDEIMKNKDLKDPDTFFLAADYYFNKDKDTDQALAWINRAVELNPDVFWMLRLQSRIQAKIGDYKAAIESAERSLKAAEKAGDQQYVRFNQEAISEWKAKL